MTAVAPPTTATPASEHERSPALRVAALVFLAAWAFHNADHLRRGVDSVTGELQVAGSITGVLSLVAVAVVVRGGLLAPAVAVAAGFGLALSFAASHLLPTWSALSDSFIDGSVDGWSWAAVIGEVGAGVLLGAVGWAVLRARGGPAALRR